MTGIGSSDTVNSALIRIDQVCDYVPIASTIINLVDVFEKCAFSCCCISESVNLNRYFSHINNKSILRCVILLLPIVGNVIVGIYDLIQNHLAEEDEKLSFVSDHAELSGSIGALFSSKSDSIKKSFAAFVVELETEIFPSYENHERGFDQHRVHGRMHIARAIIFSEVMARYYEDKGTPVDFDCVRRVTGWHDAGRQGNGIDRWEQKSSQLLQQYLISKNITREKAAQQSSIIVKENADRNCIEFKIFQSADCLDIMRSCAGQGGKAGFNPKYLTFLANAKFDEFQFRKNLIEEAWLFITITERQKMTAFNESEGFMGKLFQVIREHRDQLPILSSIL